MNIEKIFISIKLFLLKCSGGNYLKEYTLTEFIVLCLTIIMIVVSRKS
jgi:hypothetical protein